MSSDNSISRWIEKVKQGDEAAAQAIWDHYFDDLVNVARRKLQATTRRVADEEDVALSAFGSFCRAAKQGRFPDLMDSAGLWRLLSEMTRRKAVDLVRRNQRQKSGGGNVRGESVFGATRSDVDHGIGQVEADDPTPELALILAEDVRLLIDRLEDPELQQLTLAKMEGATNEEISRQLGCSLRTVERRLELIRKKLRQEPRCEE